MVEILLLLQKKFSDENNGRKSGFGTFATQDMFKFIKRLRFVCTQGKRVSYFVTQEYTSGNNFLRKIKLPS